MEKNISFPLKIKIKNEDLNKKNWLKDYISKNIKIGEVSNYEKTQEISLKTESSIASTDKSDTDPSKVGELNMHDKNIRTFDSYNQNESNEMKNFRMELKQIVSSLDNDKQASLINAGRIAKATNNVTSKTCLLS
jgi:hypothetical protein